jgi:NAD(P)-dependent dehydrogenase (short-subunit alcohol dehydrogenase family)
MELSGRVAVVTGGASGIGLALARRFARERMKVVIADVDAPTLQAAHGVLSAEGADVIAVHTDVSEAAQVEDLARQTFARYGAAHIVCNNAGVMAGGLVWQHHPKDWEWVFRVNVWGVIHGVRAFVPRLIKQDQEAHVLNTASVAGLLSNPYLGVYTAAKHAIVSISETLAMELSLVCPRIGVSVLCPGYVATNLFANEGLRPSSYALGEHEKVPPAQQMVAEGLRERIQEGMAPEDVAERALEGIRKREFCILTHPEYGASVRRRAESLLDGRVPPFEIG